MESSKKERLEAADWKVGAAAEFLKLSPEEAAYIELRWKLSEAVRRRRRERSLTQAELAQRLEWGQGRAAEVESGEDTAPLDLLIRSLLALGATLQDLAEIIRR